MNLDIPVFKIALIGCSQTGKTSLINKYINNKYEEKENSSSVTDDKRIYLKLGCLNKDEINEDLLFYYVQIQDVIGIDDPILRNDNSINFLKDIIDNNIPNDPDIRDPPFLQERKYNGYLFAFDLTEEKTFNTIKILIKEIFKKEKDNNYNYNKKFQTKKILIGTKSDWLDDKTKINEYTEFAFKYKMKFFDTSAIENININDAFEDFIREIYFDVDIDAYERELREKVKQENAGQIISRISKKPKKKIIKKGFFNNIFKREDENMEEYFDDINDETLLGIPELNKNIEQNQKCKIY